MDLADDKLVSDRQHRILNIVYGVTRECLAAISETSIAGCRVARELNDVIECRGKRGMLVSDSGTKRPADTILIWWKDHEMEWRYIAPGKPMQSG